MLPSRPEDSEIEKWEPGTNPLAFWAPGRVNLIGEHTDYTGGLVLPMAIPFYSVATISKSRDAVFRFESQMFRSVRTMDRSDRSSKTGEWSDYPVGVLRQLQARGMDIPPCTLSLRGNVPLGSGLSSSASIEVATALALLAHAGQSLSPEEIALLCQRAENEYVDSPCGIMDQFVCTAAEAGHALLLNTRDLSYDLLPMNSGDLRNTRIVIVNSTVKHSVASGDYGLRRRELEAGQALLRKRYPTLRDLGDATMEQLEACKADLSPESYRRCLHVITENARVREAGDAIRAGDPVRLGEVMTASHLSQRDNFEDSCKEIDFLVDHALRLPGCHGARLTGGGFGGCTVNLVSVGKTESFGSALQAIYRQKFKIEAPVYICEAVDGGVRLNAAHAAEV